LPLGSISTASITTIPAIGFGAAGCDSTTVGLSGVISATTGFSFGDESSATATLCFDVASLPSGALERSVRS
jgi:hypothetical protein